MDLTSTPGSRRDPFAGRRGDAGEDSVHPAVRCSERPGEAEHEQTQADHANVNGDEQPTPGSEGIVQARRYRHPAEPELEAEDPA